MKYRVHAERDTEIPAQRGSINIIVTVITVRGGFSAQCDALGSAIGATPVAAVRSLLHAAQYALRVADPISEVK